MQIACNIPIYYSSLGERERGWIYGKMGEEIRSWGNWGVREGGRWIYGKEEKGRVLSSSYHGLN